MSVLNSNGLTISIRNLSKSQIDKIREDLRVKKEATFGNFAPLEFNIYRFYSKSGELMLPLHYYLNVLEMKVETVQYDENRVYINDSTVSLRDTMQSDCYKKILNEYKNNQYGGGIINLSTGSGKCFGRDTEILMFDGTVKKVQDISNGDILMGNDSSPRKVLNTCCGVEQMYKIKYEDTFYTVNESHILSLTIIPLSITHFFGTLYVSITSEFKFFTSKTPIKSKVINVSLKKYLTLNKLIRERFLKGYRKAIFLQNLSVSLRYNIIDKGYKYNSKPLKFIANSLGYAYDSKNGVIKRRYYDIEVVKTSIDYYYGFELLGANRLFCLSDFSIVHNTVISIKLISDVKVKTLIVVNKIESMYYWKNELEKFIPNLKVGIIQANKFTDGDVIVGMLQTLTLRKNLKLDIKAVGMMIIDEVHNVCTSKFSNLLFTMRPKYVYGLTATLERKDKLDKVIRWHVGDVIYSNIGNSDKQKTDVVILRYKTEDKTILLRDGTTPNVSRMLSNMAKDFDRNKLIVSKINELIVDNKRHLLVISDRIEQLKILKKMLNNDDKVGMIIGSLSKEIIATNRDTKQVLLCTYGMVNEGFNCVRLNTLIFATPRSNVTQTIGRIYRKKHDITPTIIDIVDNYSLFVSQEYVRRKVYGKEISDLHFFYE
jgi:superfamily II DNA or RNA helicase